MNFIAVSIKIYANILLDLFSELFLLHLTQSDFKWLYDVHCNNYGFFQVQMVLNQNNTMTVLGMCICCLFLLSGAITIERLSGKIIKARFREQQTTFTVNDYLGSLYILLTHIHTHTLIECFILCRC